MKISIIKSCIVYSKHTKNIKITKILKILSIRRWSSRRFPYGYLVTTSPSSKNLDSNLTKRSKPHPSPFWVAWRAVCARSRDVFTARLWHAITTHSSFMRASYSPQSELRLSLKDYLRLSASEPIVPAIVARVLPRGFGAYGPTVVHSFLQFIIGGPLSVPIIQKRISW